MLLLSHAHFTCWLKACAMASLLGTKEGSEEYGKGAFADTSISVKKTSTEPKIEEEEEEEDDDVS